MEAAQHARGLRPRIQLLGSFRAFVGGEAIEEDHWPGRRSMELVQLLALAKNHRLAREQASEALWPHLDPDAGAANLRKAAHHARRALSATDAVVLRAGSVALFPSQELEVDAERFEDRARAALRSGEPVVCAEAAQAYGGDLLPELPYEEWTHEPRRRLRGLLVELLRRSGEWERLAELEPTEERASLELMRTALAADRRHDAIRWYGRLRTALAAELGVGPSREAAALYAECVAGLGAIEPAFVDRQIELATAAAALREAGASRLGAVLVRGSPGIGKSAFCRRLAATAEAAGWEVVTVTGARWGNPYAPIAEAVEEIVRRSSGLAARLGDHSRSVLAALTSMAIPAPPLDGQLTRHKVVGAVQRLLAARAAAAGAGLALIVDDVDAADDATAEVLYQLASGGGDGLLVVLAYRPESARQALRGAAAALARVGRAIEIDLGPLERREAQALAAVGASKTLDAEVIEEIVEVARGNPFFILELSREAPAEAPLEVGSDAWSAIAARFLEFDRGTVSMLTRLAVAGDDLDLTEVLGLTGLPETDAFQLLDRALAGGVLTVTGARYRFRHELVRQALLERLPQHQRISIHRDAARRLAGAGAPAPQVAGHWLAGERPVEALDWLLAAAREASASGAYADALRQLDPLLEHSPGHVEALSLRAEALEALGDGGAPTA
ncbi:MAG: AAA family ATPase, partial [Solirubrobacterales bacterium]